MVENNGQLNIRLLLSIDKDSALAGITKAERLTEELNWELKNLRSMLSCREEKMGDS